MYFKEPGKIMHLDEIEAFIRQGTNTAPNPSMTMPPSNHNKSDEEEAAFRKIVSAFLLMQDHDLNLLVLIFSDGPDVGESLNELQ